MVKFLVVGKLQFMGQQSFTEKKKKKKKSLITRGGAGAGDEEGIWIPLLGGSLGSQLFQVELNQV